MRSVEDLDEAVYAARAAAHDLLGVMVAHQMVPGILNLRIARAWPDPVLAAYVYWEHRISEIAGVLARRRGIESGTELSDNDRTALIIRAYVLGLDLDDR
jgi:hypothetical protein